MAVININNSQVRGNNISIHNGVITIDGKVVDGMENDKVFNISIDGDVESISNQYGDIHVKGNVLQNAATASGDILVEGGVGNNVSSASGDIKCGDVQGNVSTASGDVRAKKISGNANTVSGDISV